MNQVPVSTRSPTLLRRRHPGPDRSGKAVAAVVHQRDRFLVFTGWIHRPPARKFPPPLPSCRGRRSPGLRAAGRRTRPVFHLEQRLRAFRPPGGPARARCSRLRCAPAARDSFPSRADCRVGTAGQADESFDERLEHSLVDINALDAATRLTGVEERPVHQFSTANARSASART